MSTIANIYHDTTMLDGYSWLEQQANSIHGALHAMPEVGEWPYDCYVRGARDDNYIIKHFCEGDVKTWVFPNRKDYTEVLTQLRAEACEGLEGSVDGYGGVTV